MDASRPASSGLQGRRGPTHRERSRRLTAALALVLVLGACTGNCGGDDEGEGDDAEGGLDTTTTTSENPGAPALADGYALVYAASAVDGFGPSAQYAWSASGFEDYAARQVAEDATPDLRVVDQASCGLVDTALVIEDGVVGPADSGNAIFTANFRASQTESLSISDNGQGIVVGDYITGDGTRSGSKQWPLFRDGALKYNWTPIEDELDPGDSATSFEGFAVEATFSGVSHNDFADEAATGTVIVTCVFAFGAPSD